MSYWKRWLDRRIANVIEKAAASDKYDRIQYLCPTIRALGFRVFERVAIRKVTELLDNNHALSCYITDILKEHGTVEQANRIYWVAGWPRQLEIHRQFWKAAVEALRTGNHTGRLVVTPAMLGIELT